MSYTTHLGNIAPIKMDGYIYIYGDDWDNNQIYLSFLHGYYGNTYGDIYYCYTHMIPRPHEAITKARPPVHCQVLNLRHVPKEIPASCRGHYVAPVNGEMVTVTEATERWD